VRSSALALAAGVVVLVAVSGCASGRTLAGHGTTVPATSTSTPASPTATSTSPTAAPTLTVDGHRISAVGVHDVADAIRVAGVVPPDGRLLSVVTHRVLDAHASPAGIRVNGATATLATPVRAGDVVTFAAGADRVEVTRTVAAPFDLDAAAAALYVTYKPGQSQVVEGSISGEQVSSNWAPVAVTLLGTILCTSVLEHSLSSWWSWRSSTSCVVPRRCRLMPSNPEGK
jgi:hypothetical protein